MRKLLFFFSCLSLGTFAQAQETGASPVSALPAPLDEVRKFAENHGFALQGVEGTHEGAAVPGDSSVLLITLKKKSDLKQYLITLQVVDLNDQERAAKVADITLFASTGNKFTYSFTPVALNVTTYGPFSEKNSQLETPKTARILVNGENLGLGFDQSCRALLRIRDYMHSNDDHAVFSINFLPTPFPPAVVEKTQASGAKVKLTAAEEKALAGTMPAIGSFFNLAQNTPGLREILREVVDFPSAWSLLKRGGRLDTNINFDGSAVAAVTSKNPGAERFFLPIVLQLNGQDCLQASFVVSAAQPPLLTTAGVEAIYAKAPSNPNRTVYLEVVSARLAPRPIARVEKDLQK